MSENNNGGAKIDTQFAKLLLASILNTQKILLASEAARVGLYSEEAYKKFLVSVITVLPENKDLFAEE